MSLLQLHIDWTLFVLNVFFIFGLYYAAQFKAEWIRTPELYNNYSGYWQYKRDESEILGWLHFKLSNLIGDYWSKPFFGCVVCMASIWGTAFIVLFGTDYNIESWLVQVVAIAGINSLLRQWL